MVLCNHDELERTIVRGLPSGKLLGDGVEAGVGLGSGIITWGVGGLRDIRYQQDMHTHKIRLYVSNARFTKLIVSIA